MEPITYEHSRDRMQALRTQLSDACSALERVARGALAQDNATRSALGSSIQSIRAVIGQLDTWQGEVDPARRDGAAQRSALARAASEVASGEFDSQG
ncbi:MAG: hypothetical protein ABIP38_06650 [Steroidobacteraceae bacterium]